METQIKMKKGKALPVANALRQMAMGSLPAWRPIAISLNREFNNLRASSDIVQDVTQIISNILSFKYSIKVEHSGDFIKEKFVFNRNLKTSGMKSEYFDVIGRETDIITSLDDRSVVLTLIYRKAVGQIRDIDNADFLISNGEKREDYLVLATRHTDVDNFTYDINDSSLEEETLVIRVESDTYDENKILKDAIASLKSALAELEAQV